MFYGVPLCDVEVGVWVWYQCRKGY